MGALEAREIASDRTGIKHPGIRMADHRRTAQGPYWFISRVTFAYATATLQRLKQDTDDKKVSGVIRYLLTSLAHVARAAGLSDYFRYCP
jgi:hypothetical protein